jgi:hypothetical protein
MALEDDMGSGKGKSVFLNYVKNYSAVHQVCMYRFATRETIAHLEYLRAKGRLERELVEGLWIYAQRKY